MIDFTETQRPPTAMKIILGVAMAMMVFTFGAAILLTEIDQPDTTWYEVALPLGFLVLVMIVLGVAYGRTKQHVQITSADLRIRQAPFHRRDRVFPWSDVTTVVYRPFSAMGEFGGWGIRYNMRDAWGYVLSGDRAIEVHLANGKKRIISIVDGQGARAALEALHTEHGVNVRFLTQR